MRQRVDRELARFLADPAPLAATTAEAQRVGALHARLLAGEDPAALKLEALEPGAGPAARLLAAEAELVAGRPERALDELAVLPPDAAAQPASRLVAGRAEELVGDLVAAVLDYRAAAALEVAAQRARELEAAAVAALETRIDEALAAGRPEAARTDIGTLESWRPGEPATLRRVARHAGLDGDAERELAALRALAQLAQTTPREELRRGTLEVEIGDAAMGLDLLAAAAARRPDDPTARGAWLAARFRFRLVNSPEPVRASARAAELRRADFARMLYWLVPDVRASRAVAPRIATDVLDHSARDEIVRVVNLGLMTLEPSLRRFEPDLPLARIDAFRALLRILDGSYGDGAGERLERGGELCARAAALGWVSEAAACLPSAPVSGPEATRWIRRVVEPEALEEAG